MIPLQVAELVPGEGVPVAGAIRPREGIQAERIADRDGTQHICVKKREKGKVQSEAECDRSDYGEHKAGTAPETPCGVAHVLNDGFEQLRAAKSPAIFFHSYDP